MPFNLADILFKNNGNKTAAAVECRCIATAFPEKRKEFTKYAEQLEKGR